MKATINRDGILTIEAESEIEAYALARWSAENSTMGEDTKMLIKGLPQHAGALRKK